MFTALLVEDDEFEGIKLGEVLKKIQPQVEAVLCRMGEEAIEHMERHPEHMDIFFIDRDLPGMDGLELASKIREKKEYVNTPIVFVTGYDSNLVEVFQEYHCYSYILKPYDEAVMKGRLEKLLMHLGEKKPTEPLRKAVILQVKEGQALVYVDDILYLERGGKACLLYTKSKTYELPHASLEKQLDEINDLNVVRCHKSFAVNLRNVREIKKMQRNIWIPIFEDCAEEHCEISKTYYEAVTKLFHDVNQ